MAEQDDAGLGSFVGAQDTIMIRIEEANDGAESSSATPIFEHLQVGIFGQPLARALSKLDRAVMRIVVVNESADEAD
jgi:hypothetical protein